MAIFQDENSQRLDWNLLQNGPITLYYRRSILTNDCLWLQNHNYFINYFDCSAWQNQDDLHQAFAAELAFPDYYGRNLDALNDCLSDLIIPEESGRVLVFYCYDQVARLMPEVAWPILDIIAYQARHFLLIGRRLMALIQSDDPHIRFDPVGACSINWNGRERLNKDCGL